MKLPFSGLWQEFKAFAFKGNMVELAVAVVIGAAFSQVVNAMVSDIVMPSITYVVMAVTSVKNTATESVHAVAEKTGMAATQPSTQATSQPTAGTVTLTASSVSPPSPDEVVLKNGDKITGTVVSLADGNYDIHTAAEGDLKIDKSQIATISSGPAPAPPAAATPATPDNTKVVNFDLDIGLFHVGHFVGALINFLIVSFAVFIMIVKLLGSVAKRVGGTPEPSEPTTKECPFCLSVIPLKAKKCPDCTADLPAI